jgi:hypothetical protein
MKDGIFRHAEISDCGRFRYTLTRSWFNATDSERYITYIGLNPSTADGLKDDATIRRLIAFTKSFGYNGFEIRNLYAIRATDPKTIDYSDLTEFGNHFRLTNCIGDIIVFCWGANRRWPEWQHKIQKLEEWYKGKIYCFGNNKDGSPKHPLYLRSDIKLQPWRPL